MFMLNNIKIRMYRPSSRAFRALRRMVVLEIIYSMLRGFYWKGFLWECQAGFDIARQF